MRTFSAGLTSALESPTAIIATYTKITRQDGHVLRLVDLDQDSTVAGEIYTASGGAERTAVEIAVGLGADNVDIRGIFDDTIWDEDELLSGAYNYAEVEIFLAVHGDASLEKIPLLIGYFGEIEYDTGQFRIKVNCYNYGFTKNIGAVTSPVCRDRLGGPRCKVNLATIQAAATVTEIIDPLNIRVTPAPLASHAQGTMTMTSGTANGAGAEIKSVSGDVATLYLPFAISPAVGDGAVLTPGCPGTRAACRDTFNNLLNMDAEPDLPGQDEFFSPTVRRV